MIRLSKLTDYGFVVLTRFATTDEPLSENARDIAQDVSLPLPTVSKILKLLAKSGLLIAHRGAKGGYRLARQPAEISVVEIIRALDGPIAITECVGEDHSGCAIGRTCPVRSSWELINNVVFEALQKITLADLASRHAAEPPCRQTNGSGDMQCGHAAFNGVAVVHRSCICQSIERLMSRENQ